MMTTEGWVGIMSNGIDATGIEKQPKEKNNEYMALYFVLFMILGSFLLINLFTAVITDNFNKIKASKEIGAGAVYVNSRAKEWVDVQNIAVNVKPTLRAVPRGGKFRQWFYTVVTHPLFDLAIIVVIILNTIVIAMVYARMSDSYSQVIEDFNFFFVI